jgi:hypothetical protein
MLPLLTRTHAHTDFVDTVTYIEQTQTLKRPGALGNIALDALAQKVLALRREPCISGSKYWSTLSDEFWFSHSRVSLAVPLI